ncbi:MULTISPECIES: DUF1146 domain-containing protein [Terrabacteria group]|uniref:DUF1146 domain-containing protein n=1 Tax=Bacillati TaxID=1783272 RepID=UPI001C6EEEDD|nr:MULTISPECIES: DUF1146 domain-containing protein [Terrabacteria group]MBW9212939.1 DUF1146 domain-containing protein [Trueperella sp. zg.1013]
MFKFYLQSGIYLIALVLSFYALQALDFERILRKNKVNQAQVLYGLLVIALAYLVGSFLLFFIH